MPTITPDDIRAAIHVLDERRTELVRDLIGMELLELEPVWDENISAKADAAKLAMEALEKPEGVLQVLRMDLDEAEEKVRQIQAGLDIGLLDERAETWMKVQAYEHQRDILREQVAKVEADLVPLKEKFVETRLAAENAIAGKSNWAAAVAFTYDNELAQQTTAYIQYRLPHLLEVAVLQDREHPEARQAEKLAKLMALATGFRSCRKCGGSEDLPDDRTMLLSVYDDYSREKIQKAVGSPSMTEVINAQNEVMRRIGEDKNHRDKIEDLRGVKVPPKLTSPEFRQRQDIAEFTRPR